MRVLGIETSCDETAAAVYDSDHGLLGHTLYSQVEIHAAFGGVVPELASRDHVRKLLPLIREVLQKSKLALSEIDGVAYTSGPGLVGALLVGACLGRSLAYALDKPALGIHHLEGHLLAPLLETPAPTFPFLALLVSGGHTLLVRVAGIGRYTVLGETLDDAVGEAFDKCAKLLGLSYPGGPELAALAERGTPDAIRFPRPMTGRPGLDFSFSGLKTAVRVRLEKGNGTDTFRADVARGFQDAVIETLSIKTKRALQQTGLTRLVVTGGVGANKQLRHTLKEGLEAEVFYPRPEFCTDNAAMIAFAGYQRLAAGQSDDLQVVADPRWSLATLKAPGNEKEQHG